MSSTHETIVAYDGPVKKRTQKHKPTVISHNLKRLRDIKGWTQKQLSEIAEVSSVAMIESGAHPQPRQDTMNRLASALGVPVAEFYLEMSGRSPEEQKTLDEFLSSPLAADASEDEKRELSQARWPLPGSVPTVKSWMFLLEAVRAAKGGR